MIDFLTSPYFLLFARLCVGGVFLVSGIGKLLDRAGTAASMARYPFLPAGSGRLIANVFPFIEMVVGALLVIGLFTRPAALMAALLFVLFTGLILYDLAHNANQSCHCFGRLSDEKVTPMSVVRNGALMLLALLVLDDFDGWLALDGGSGGASLPSTVDAVPVILLALFTIAAVVWGERAVSTVRTTLRVLGFR